MSALAGFTDADFDAYAPKKWKSNVYNRERLEVKQRLLALGREISPHARSTDGALLTVEASVEHPDRWNHRQVEAQHLFFSRDERARKELDGIIEKGKSIASLLEDPSPQRNHVFLSLSLDHERVTVALRLHPEARVDRQNLERRCEDHFERGKLLAVMHGLSPGYEFGITGGALTPAASVTDESLRAGIAALEAPAFAPPGTAPRLLHLGRSWLRGEALAAGAALPDALAAALDELSPIYQFIAWSRENDFVSIRETLQKEKQTRKQRGLAAKDEVRIVRGLLQGKSGVVQEIDARGGLKVLVGQIAVKVAAEDVEKR